VNRRRRLRGVLLCGAFAAAIVRPAHAALPDWARALADAAPAVPADVSALPTRVLLSETTESLRPDGTVHIRRHFAAQILSVRGSDVGTGFFPFNERTSITATRAWHLPPGEDKAHRDRAPALDIKVDSAFLSGHKVRDVQVYGVLKGSLVFFEFEAIEHPTFLSFEHAFFENAPVLLDRYILETPPGFTLRSAWVGPRGPEPRVDGRQTIWEMRDLPAPVEEPLAEDPYHTAPHLYVQPLPEGGGDPPRGFPPSFRDWAAMASWYDGLARDRRAASPALEAASRQKVPAAEAPFFERVKAAALLVRDGVRYTALELGIGGYQPRPAADTFHNLYGDCKDKGTLFQAVLGTAGIASYPVLIYLGSSDPVPESIPAWAFNHFVVAVPLPEKDAADPRVAPARFEAPGHGPMFIVDTTDERTPVGELSISLTGHRALLIEPANGALVTLPAASPDRERVLRQVGVERRADRSVAVSRLTRLWGEPAAAARDEEAHSAIERRRRIERGIVAQWPEAAIDGYAVVAEGNDGAFEELLTVIRPPGHASLMEGNMVRLFPWLESDIPRANLGRRTVALIYPHPMVVRHETAIQGVPENVMLPTVRDLSGDGWTVHTECRREGNDVKAVAEVRLTRTRFGVDAFPELRRFWSALGAAGADVVGLGTNG
jgi:hypothetical protein